MPSVEPNVELHRHLDCSIRPSTLRELLAAAGVNLPASEAEFRARYLITEPMRDLGSVLAKFMAAQKALSSEDILTRITMECIEGASREGTRLLELRYAPTFIQDGHEHLSFDAIHQAIVRGIKRSQDLPIAVGLIAIVQRTKPISVGDSVVDFAIANRDSFIGIDLADNEVGFEPLPFEAMFRRAKKSGLHITVHAGEVPSADSPKNVVTAIDRLGAERIGHGLQIANPAFGSASAAALKRVVETGTVLEICPTSNVLTNAVPSLAEHPLRRLRDSGVKVTINTDDPGVFDLSLSSEYAALKQHLGMTDAEIAAMNAVAAAASFLPAAERARHWPMPQTVRS